MDTSISLRTSQASMRLRRRSPSPLISSAWHRPSGPVSSRSCPSTSSCRRFRIVDSDLSLAVVSFSVSKQLAGQHRLLSLSTRLLHSPLNSRALSSICCDSRSCQSRAFLPTQITTDLVQQTRDACITDRAETKGEGRTCDSSIGDRSTRTAAHPTIPLAIRRNEEYESNRQGPSRHSWTRQNIAESLRVCSPSIRYRMFSTFSPPTIALCEKMYRIYSTRMDSLMSTQLCVDCFSR